MAARDRLRIMVLCYVDPADGSVVDPVVPAVARALEANGHEAHILSVHRSIYRVIRGIRKFKPDLVFNLLEQFGERTIGTDIAAVGLLDLLGVPYTGGGPGEYYLSGDKGLSKKILAFEGIDFPKFAVFAKGAGFETGGNLRMPMFVKPLRLDASLGIENGEKALVRDAKELIARVTEIHDKHNDDALAEEYIDGRELYVAILGNEQPIAFPPIEIDFSGMPADKPKVMDAKAKFDRNSPEYKGTRARIAKLADDLAARLQKVSLDAYRALRVRDYGRVDLRVTPTGDIYVIEVNASCYLDHKGEFAMAAKAGGIQYNDLIQRIVDAALARQKREHPEPAQRAG
jgi:D-alanine-D-alanine ligase